MKSLNLLVSVLFLLCTLPAVSQSTGVTSKTLTWNSDGGTDVRSGQAFTDDWKIVTQTMQTIKLTRGTDQTLEFDIDSVAGTWADENQEGQLTYTVKYQDSLVGNIKIQRQSSSLIVFMNAWRIKTKKLPLKDHFTGLTR